MKFTDKDIERFFEKVQKSSSGCWIWTAQRSEDGYGRFMVRTSTVRKNYLAHRFSYIIHFGDIPDGLEVCHHCDVPACIRPEHLFCGSHQDNCIDRTKKRRDILFSGERNGQHKLTSFQVMKIRELPLPPESIASQFNISVSQVNRLKNYKQWKHLPVQQFLFNDIL